MSSSQVHNEGMDKESVRGQTPLTLACRAGHYGMSRVLLDRGANANYETARGLTALMEAARFNHSKIVDLLVEHKVRTTTGSDD